MIQWLRCVFNRHEPESIGLEFGVKKKNVQAVRIVEICKHCGILYVVKGK